MKTWRVQYRLADGRAILDPTVFRTRKAAEMRIGALSITKGASIVVRLLLDAEEEKCPSPATAY